MDGTKFFQDMHYDDSFKRVCPFLLASLVYHYHTSGLHNLLPRSHSLFCQQIFADLTLVNTLKDKVILCFGYCRNTGMSAEVVPAFITISREIRTFRSVYEGDRNSIIRCVGDLEDTLSEEVMALPDNVIEKLLARFHVEGVIQTSKEDLVMAILEELSKPSEQQETIILRLNAGCDVNYHGDAPRGRRFSDLSQYVLILFQLFLHSHPILFL